MGVPRNADKALAAIRESKGLAICVTDEEILAAQRLLGRTCGVFGEPAGVTGTAALKKACEQGLIEKDATVVSVVTGNGLKDVANAIKSAGEPLHIEPDLDLMVMDRFLRFFLKIYRDKGIIFLSTYTQKSFGKEGPVCIR